MLVLQSAVALKDNLCIGRSLENALTSYNSLVVCIMYGTDGKGGHMLLLILEIFNLILRLVMGI